MSQGVGELSVQLVSKISNLLDHNPPTSQTDRQKHDMQSQDCDLHLYSTSCDKNQITTVLKLTMIVLHGFRVRQNDANRIPSSMEVPQNTNHSHFMVSPKISTGEHRRIRIVSYYQQAEQHSAMLIQITYNSRLHNTSNCCSTWAQHPFSLFLDGERDQRYLLMNESLAFSR